MKYFSKRKLVTLALFVSTSMVYGQQHKIDSLELLIQKNKGLAKYEPLVAMLRLHFEEERYQQSLTYAKLANELALKYGDTVKIVESGRRLGRIYREASMINEAEKVILATLPIAERHAECREEYRELLNGLGFLYTFKGIYDKALETDMRMLRLAEDAGDRLQISHAVCNIGVVYYKLKNYSRAADYFKRALALKKQVNDVSNIPQVRVNIALSYTYLNELALARQHLDSALFFCKTNRCHNESFVHADAFFCLGVIEMKAKKFVKAERHFLASYDLAVKSGMERYQFDNIDYLCQIYFATNQIDKASKYLEIAEEKIRGGSPFALELIKIYKLFVQRYQKSKDFKQLSHYQQKYIELKDSVYDDDLRNNLMRLDADFQEKANLAQIASQKRILALDQEVIRRQQFLNLAISVIAILLIIVTVVLIRSNRRRLDLNRLLDNKVRERTRQLEESQTNLQAQIEALDLSITKFSKAILHSIGSLQTLCAMGIQEFADASFQEYLHRMRDSYDSIVTDIRNLKQENR